MQSTDTLSLHNPCVDILDTNIASVCFNPYITDVHSNCVIGNLSGKFCCEAAFSALFPPRVGIPWCQPATVPEDERQERQLRHRLDYYSVDLFFVEASPHKHFNRIFSHTRLTFTPLYSFIFSTYLEIIFIPLSLLLCLYLTIFFVWAIAVRSNIILPTYSS